MTSEWAARVGRAWRESAPFWAKNSETVREMFEPITTALLAEADMVYGQSVLDVAGGPGEPSMTIAGRVGLAGRVVHTDLAPGMVAATRGEALRQGLDTMRFALASGDALPFADGSFDRVVCRLGLAFFPDPAAGLAEMLRVARAEGRVAVAVWGAKERNPFFAVASEIVARHVPSADPPDPTDPWRFGEPGLVAGMLERAGATRASERRVDFEIAAPLDFEQYWVVRVQLSDTLRGRLGGISDAARRAVADEVREATRQYFAEHTMRFPAEAVVASGSAP